MVKKAIDVLKNIISKWNGLVVNRKYIAIAIFIIIPILTFYSLNYSYLRLLLIYDIALVCLAVSALKPYTREGEIAFTIAIALFIVTNYILWIIPLIIALHMLYLLMHKRRINKAKRIAKMNPSQLSGIHKSKPEFEIILRRD